MNFQESMELYARDRVEFERRGAIIDGAKLYATDEIKANYLAFDAQPALQTAPNSGIPYWLTTYVDPAVYEILFAPTEGAPSMRL
jgi:hypothetical protein